MIIVREELLLGNGERISVQASKFHYCTPRENDAESYTTVEVGNVDNIELPEEWAKYRGGEWSSDFEVYAYIPVNLVWDMIQSKGGLVSPNTLKLGE